MLKIENLHVSVNNKKILKGVNLEIKKSEIHVLIGPNASGKTTLVYAILGNPKYKIESGKIIFENKEITKLETEERVNLGISVAFQNPPELKGIKFSTLLQKISKIKIDLKEFGVEHLAERELNYGFSGGEKRISELIQALSLNPKFLILDEIDSGLDLIKIKKVANIIKKFFDERHFSVLLITHKPTILKILKPNFVHVMLNGKIICSTKNWKMVFESVENYGFEKCRECKFFAD